MAMLSQYDRQQLELISSRLHIEDPGLAKSFREWRPRPEQKVRRWPFAVLMVLAGLVFLAGILVGSFSFLFLGTLAGSGVVVAYRRHGRAPRSERSERSGRSRRERRGRRRG